MESKFKYYAAYKPFGMLSQFSREGDRKALVDLDVVFPKDVYPVGRLDADSEGLLLLTNERSLTARLLEPSNGHEREYWVQVEGVVSEEALRALSSPMQLRIDGVIHRTMPCKARKISPPDELPERIPPVRFRKSVPDEWISIAIKEGKNRQVRRMTAAVGLPTLRLIRYRMGKLVLPEWTPGRVTPLSREEFLTAIA